MVAAHRVDGDHLAQLRGRDRGKPDRQLGARLGVGWLGLRAGYGFRWPAQRAARLTSRMSPSFSLPRPGRAAL